MNTTNKTSYKIYITKSIEAACLISEALITDTPWSKEGGVMLSVSSGCVREDCRIPALYHGRNNFYALIEYRNGEDYSNPEYSLILC